LARKLNLKAGTELLEEIYNKQHLQNNGHFHH